MAKNKPPQKTLGELSNILTQDLTPLADAETGAGVAIFTTQSGTVRVETRIADGTVWLSQKSMAQLYGITVATINRHLQRIFESGELLENSVVTQHVITATDGKNYQTSLYNLDAIIHVGYRVRSSAGALFRAWATERLKEYMVKGFTLDDERLKNPQVDDSHYEELLARIRDIRTSEKRFYQKVRDLISLTSEDYASRKGEQSVRDFFAAVQNKMLYATTGKTAAELIMERANANKVNMGLTTFKGNVVRIGDIVVSKNYLTESELVQLNELVQMFILFAEDRAKQRQTTFLEDWMTQTDSFLVFYGRAVLHSLGTQSSSQMEDFVRHQYEIYCARQKQAALEQAEQEYEDELIETVLQSNAH